LTKTVSEGASHPSEQKSLAGDPGRERGRYLRWWSPTLSAKNAERMGHGALTRLLPFERSGSGDGCYKVRCFNRHGIAIDN
jgi:hypothetical protein